MSALDFHESVHARRGASRRGSPVASAFAARIAQAPPAPPDPASPPPEPTAAALPAAAEPPDAKRKTKPVVTWAASMGDAWGAGAGDAWGAGAGDARGAGAGDARGAGAGEAAAPAPRAAPARVEPPTADEACLMRWFQETHVEAKNRADYSDAGEKVTWVDGATEGAHTIEMTQERMKEIGLTDANGQPPSDDEPARLYWIQDKPVGQKAEFGYWDPVNAQWKMYPGRTVVPVEQRISPMGHGYGVGDDGALSKDNSFFTARDYDKATKYSSTALHAGLSSILEQIEGLGADAQVSSTTGWGSAADGNNKLMFYTPNMRHLQINEGVEEHLGKKYVYSWGGKSPVKPVAAGGEWNETNTCWVFPIGADGRMHNEDATVSSCTERDRDAQLQ
jgi:hypothetical protein